MGNPFTRVLGEPESETPESQNPFTTALRGPIGGDIGLPDGGTPAGAAFIEGIKRGILTPFQIFRAGTKEDEIDSGHPIARTLGEFGGILVSFVPFFKASQIALRGVGLTARLAPNVRRVVEGATTFGLFEAGSAEELAEVPEEFLKGAAIGVGFEIGIIGLARTFRAGLPKTPKGARVNPDGAKVENAISPNNGASEAEILNRVTELAPKGAKPTEVAALLTAQESTAGIGIIPAITNPKEFASFVRANLPDMNVILRETEPGVSEALLFRQLTPKQTGQFLKTGQVPGTEIIHNGVSKEVLSQSRGSLVLRGPTGLIERATTADVQKAVQLEELSSGRAFVDGLEDAEVRKILEDNLTAARGVSDDLGTLAERAELKLERSSDGRFLVQSQENINLGNFATEAEARGFLMRWGPSSRRDILQGPEGVDPPVQIKNLILNNEGIVDETATLATLPPILAGTTRVYRAESPTIGFRDVFKDKAFPGDIEARRLGLQGKYYTDELKFADYFRQTYGRDATIKYADIPVEQLGQFQVSPGEYVMEFSPKIGGGAGGPPTKLQALDPGLPSGSETPGVLQRLADGINTLLFRTTSLVNYSQTAERVGHGRPFTRIQRPLDDAVKLVDTEMGVTAREALGGRTFNAQLKRIQDVASKIPKERFETIRNFIESMSRQEVQSTRGLVEGLKAMTPTELQIGRLIEKVGLGDHVPRLLSLARSARSLERGKKAFRKRVRKLTANQEVPPEIAEQLARLEQVAKETPETFDGILDAYGASKEEKFVISMLEKGNKLSKDEFSSFVVSRWLVAPEKKSGFKTMRDQFASENAMTAQELRVATEVDAMLEAAFAESGMSARRQIAGYWSHMRTWSENGMGPDRFMERIIPKRSIDWSANRFRSGELNTYEVDPVLMAYKYTRGLFSKRHIDPALKVANKELKNISNIDTRTYRVMREYINEIMGTPHASFNRIDASLASFMKATGLDSSKARGLSARLTNELAGLAYQASIPFRPALILRNYFQMVQMTPPRIGFKHFYKGIEKAIEKDGFEEAVKRGVVPVDVVPLHAATEILPQVATKALRPLGLKYRRLFDAGFRWYRKADDLGRAVAYHGMKSRINAHLPDYMGGKINWETFLSRSKVNTFDSNDIAEFTRLFRDGQIEEAGSYLGGQLAGEAHFRYGHANHPAGWGSIYGRLFGQFGTWPVQYKDFLVNGLARGSAKDKAEFFATHIALNLGMVTAGSAVGLNLWSWVSFPSLQYTGGPFADMTIDVVKALSGSDAEKSMARRSLFFQLPTLDDPRSIFVPGSYFIADLKAALGGETPGEQVLLRAAGFRFLEPGEKGQMDWLLDSF